MSSIITTTPERRRCPPSACCMSTKVHFTFSAAPLPLYEQNRVEQCAIIVHDTTLLIQPLISNIQHYHGRFGYGDVVHIYVPSNALSSSPVERF
jgi:hypothetical protein